MGLIKGIRKAVRRQKIRNHIRREEEEFLLEHPELRLPKRRPYAPTGGLDSLPGIDPPTGSKPGAPTDFDD